MLHKKTKLGKRIWSLLLCLCMVLPCLPVSVFAAGETEASCTVDGCSGTYENGFCNICDGYQAATLNDNDTTDTSDDYYEIGNAGQLYWFAAKVNNDKEWNLNGKLTADITVNENLVENVKFSNEGYITDDLAVTPRTWTPIGGDNYNWQTINITSGVGYAGTFDGDGKTISGLYYDSRKEKISEDDKWGESLYAVGLFSFLNGATLRDITVTDSIFYSAHHIDNTSDKVHRYLCLGGIAGGVVEVDKATTIEGCTVTSSVLTANQRSGNGDSASGNYNVRLGGIVGELFVLTSSAQATIKNCTASHTEFKRVVIADKEDGCGGIVGGVNWNAGSLTIEGCTNASDVTPTNIYTGGIVGYVVSSKSGKKVSFTIKNCANTGDVSTPEDAPSSTANVGGILGTFYVPSTVVAITIENCYNTGAVSALAVSDSKNAVAAAGGLIGSAVMGSSNITVKNCYNTGAVSALAVPESGEYEAAGVVAGGLIGSAAMGSSGITVKNCYNTGAVTAEFDGEDGTPYAGAVIGKLTGTGTRAFSGLYYKTGTATDESGDGTTVDGATEKSAEEFASGEVCYLLNGETDKGTLVWYQILVEGGDPSPVLDSTHGVVSCNVAEDGTKTYSSTGTLTTVSVTITWTSMAFAYTDGAWDPETHDYDIGTWSTSGGTVTVENTGNVTVTASFFYTSETGITDISGSFEASSFDLAEKESQTTTLTLSGKPSKSLNNDRIGTITVTIAQKNE